jgi:hypothetical protein
MYSYRITKYNPKHRNNAGAYTKDEWTEFSDVGKKFDGKTLTYAQYIKVEDAYVKVLLSFLRESNIPSMKVYQVQNPKKIPYGKQLIKKNQTYSLDDLEKLFRLILRGELWCKFKNADSTYVDFGWDYYSYIGIPEPGMKSIQLAKKLKLYVESFPEPIL